MSGNGEKLHMRSRGRATRSLIALVPAVTLAVMVAGVRPALAEPAGSSDHGGNVLTFESDPVGSVPSGCSAPTGLAPAVVSDVVAYHSAHSLRVDDDSTSTQTGVSCPIADQVGGVVRLMVYPEQLQGGFLVDIDGTLRGISGGQSIFRLGFAADGSISWYDGTSYIDLAGAHTVPLQHWTSVVASIPSDGSVVHLWVGGRYVGDGGPEGVREAVAVTGLTVLSHSTETAGDDVYVDNVTLDTADDASPPGASSEPHIGQRVIVGRSATPIEFPQSAVVVPKDQGQRVILSYNAHPDSSAPIGTGYVVSDDGGEHWADAPASNPMPDVHSYSLTRLRSGDVIAVPYHIFPVAGSGGLQAEVDSSVSHDNGATWQQRVGFLTAPQPMRTGAFASVYVSQRGPIEDPDGTLYLPAYGYYQGDTLYRQFLLVSNDGGVNWAIRATVAFDPTGRVGYAEGAVERVADGSLLMVMRAGATSYEPMYVARSTDNGMTWTKPELLRVGPRNQTVLSVKPQMELLPGGTLVLLVGRPGLALLTSPDGSGRTWTSPVEIDYQNSGNGALVATDATHLLVFGDAGADWSLPTPDPYGIWARCVTVGRGTTDDNGTSCSGAG